MKVTKNKEYYTVKEVAKILDVTEQTVRNYIYLGKFKSDKKIHTTIIYKEEIDRYIKDAERKA